MALVSELCFLPALIAMKMKGVTLENLEATFTSDPQTALVLMLVFLACSIPAVYFGFCWMFALPLVVDKGLSFWPAMQLSRNKVLQHPWRIGVLLAVAGIYGFSGALLFGIGILFTLPLYFGIKLALYEAIFRQD
ncbi:MAG: glycerophosphoryl diester phosphodiesterase membrane domain-containing protein [Verrucomicrobia bacterium]|nr:glycerophosphoryl diester phosphodiesterase membrane domain-containing protein [Verrucomicrobiota bacterium]